MSEFCLSDKINFGNFISKIPNDTDTIKASDVKEFIKEIGAFMQDRLEFLSEFDGLAEVRLQKAEISSIKLQIDKLAGSKLTE